jgi:hypothetical protein
VRRVATYTGLAVLGISSFYACSDTAESGGAASNGGNGGSTTSAGGGNGGTAGAGGQPTSGGAPASGGTGGVGGNGGSGGSCSSNIVAATHFVQPADIVFIVDNSGSMGDEASQVRSHINVNFHTFLGAFDHRVIMLTQHSNASTAVCVHPPLSAGNCNGPPVDVPGQFYHYDIQVDSHDALCIMLDTLYGSNAGGEADEQNAYPDGWITALRPEALKAFVAITDDGTNCNWNGTIFNDGNIVGDTMPSTGGKKVAEDWSQELLNLSPAQFGSSLDPNYVFYSVVAIPFKNPQSDPYLPNEPVTQQECVPGADPGTGYQWLSTNSGGLRYPVCADGGVNDYGPVFQGIATDLIDRATDMCVLDLPPPPMGQMLDLDALQVLYTAAGMGAPQIFTKVASAAMCGADNFYIENNLIKLCPTPCATVEADATPQLDIEILCSNG